ncbi:PilN domain-containing protein [Pseudomonas sp. CC120222-01a]|uniref:PilN domain-containing protein n=1 Tax=Pseudomonas sp. CC120222-01a TaxID=1378075 RepID=UPI000D96E780|nr:PilN domain-containing protein [Pseudomonas sp. CC120222-01a]PVZ43055.1 type IV pilus assembly protein PilN [Pseudomonas sp. CC120222-01a]
MLRLNLMPWRERQRLAALRRLRLMLLGAAVLALSAVLLIDQLARQRARQQAVASDSQQAAIEVLERQVAKHERIRQSYDEVRAQAVALADLRAEQGLVTAVFADLERALPEGVQLLRLELQGSRLRMVGVAASGAVVAQLMRELERSGAMRELELKSLNSQPGGDEFQLLARMSASWS